MKKGFSYFGWALILVVILSSGQPKQPAPKFTGKFTSSIYMNGVRFDMMPQAVIYFDGDHAVELSIEKQIYTQERFVAALPDKSTATVSSRDTTVGYYVWNIGKDKYTYIDVNFQVRERGTLSAKKKGVLFAESLKEIEMFVEKFVPVNDTLISKVSYTKLVYREPSTDRVYTALVNKSLQHSPFHPISSYLDRKFNGMTSSLEISSVSQGTALVAWNYNPKLSLAEEALVSKISGLAQ